MSDTFTSALRLCKPEVGSDDGTWGTLLNTETIDMIDEAVGGYVAISVASGDVTLSTANGTTDQARNAVIKFTGSPGTDRTITAPVIEKTYWLINGVGDSSNILFKATGGSTVTIPAGCRAKVYTDGTTTAVILFLYGEGTWTPADGSGAALSFTVTDATWVKNGQLVFLSAAITYPATADTSAAIISGLPFASRNTTSDMYGGVPAINSSGAAITILVTKNASTLQIANQTTAANKTNANMSTATIRFGITYRAAA